ncbi:MAG: hypothetical protein M3421_09395 [Bacteroidota bacterium]|nr:hypothetical protein [Bacteroidota bacterium]
MRKKQLFKKLLPLTFVICASLLSCDKDEDPKIVDQTLSFDCNNNMISTNTTLEDIVAGEGVDYIISCPVTIKNNAILTINPGVTIQFNGATSGLFVSGDAGLNAVGTAEKPIKFFGKILGKGSWKGIFFGSNNPANQLAYATVANAGSEPEFYSDAKAAVSITTESNNARASIINCTITESAGNGLWVAIGRNLSEFKNNNFTNNAEAPVALTFDSFDKLDAASKYKEGNGKQYIDMYGEGPLTGVTINKDMKVIPLEVPYRISGPVFIEKAVTIEPGTIMEFNPGAQLTTSGLYFETTGSLNATGTAENRIVFKGVQGGSGAWIGIEFASKSPHNKLIYCDIIGGGSEGTYGNGGDGVGNIVIGNYYDNECSAVIQNCNIKDSDAAGIAIRTSSTYTSIENTFENNKLGDVSAFK